MLGHLLRSRSRSREVAPGHIYFWQFGRNGQESSAGIVLRLLKSVAEDLQCLILSIEYAPVVSDTAVFSAENARRNLGELHGALRLTVLPSFQSPDNCLQVSNWKDIVQLSSRL